MRRRMMAALAVVALLVTMPAEVGAAPPEDSCASFRHVTFTAAVPSSFRTSGHHEFEFLTTWVDPDGTPQQDFAQNELDVALAGPTYVGNVLLRPASVWGLQGDGTVERHVATIDDGQGAWFFAQIGFDAGDPIGESSSVSVRWETSPGMFTGWVVMAKRPITVGCEPGQNGLFHRTFG